MCYEEYVKGLMYEGFSKEDAMDLADAIFGERNFLED